MHRALLYAAYSWLTFSGTMHFLIDVVSQYLRNKRPPGSETTLYYGLNTAYALGQVAFGLMGLWVAYQAMELLGQWPMVFLSLAAALCWLAFGFYFMSYWEPRFNAALFAVLVIAAAIAG